MKTKNEQMLLDAGDKLYRIVLGRNHSQLTGCCRGKVEEDALAAWRMACHEIQPEKPRTCGHSFSMESGSDDYADSQ